MRKGDAVSFVSPLSLEQCTAALQALEALGSAWTSTRVAFRDSAFSVTVAKPTRVGWLPPMAWFRGTLQPTELGTIVSGVFAPNHAALTATLTLAFIGGLWVLIAVTWGRHLFESPGTLALMAGSLGALGMPLAYAHRCRHERNEILKNIRRFCALTA